MKIEVELYWGLYQGPLETAFNKDIQACFDAKDLGKINLLTVKFPDIGPNGIEYDLEYSGGGQLKLAKVKYP